MPAPCARWVRPCVRPRQGGEGHKLCTLILTIPTPSHLTTDGFYSASGLGTFLGELQEKDEEERRMERAELKLPSGHILS